MRLLTRKLDQAFPQLEAYDEDTGRQFFELAAGSRGWRLWRLCLATVFSLLIIVPCAVAGIILTFGLALGQSQRGGESVLFAGLLCVGLFVISLPLWVLFFRDRLLKSRINAILTADSTCKRCRYSLIGIAPSATGLALCPECGSTSPVHPAIGVFSRPTP